MAEKKGTIGKFYEIIKSKAVNGFITNPAFYYQEAGLKNKRSAYAALQYLIKKGKVKRTSQKSIYQIDEEEKIFLTPEEKKVFDIIPSLVKKTACGPRIKEVDLIDFISSDEERNNFIEKMKNSNIFSLFGKHPESGIIFSFDEKKYLEHKNNLEVREEKKDLKIKSKEEIIKEIDVLKEKIERLQFLLNNYDLIVNNLGKIDN